MTKVIDELDSHRLSHPLAMSLSSHFPELSGRATLVKPNRKERLQHTDAQREVYEVVGEYIMARLTEYPELTHIGLVVDEVPGVRIPLRVPDMRVIFLQEPKVNLGSEE